MKAVPDRSNHLPEDNLPGWAFHTQDCEDCGLVIDERYDYERYCIEVCVCSEEE